MATPPTTQNNVTTQEALLLDYLQRLDEQKDGRRAVHVHLSELQAQNRRDHHIRMASDAFDPLIKMQDGQLFILKNADLFFIVAHN